MIWVFAFGFIVVLYVGIVLLALGLARSAGWGDEQMGAK